jgi:UDP-2-acetamido-2-deoxy-ribo-hexuluronate aminotransferase
MEFIDLKQQYALYKDRIDNAIHRVLDHGQYIMGPEIRELEGVLAKYVGRKHAITVGSGTQSLEIALRAMEIGPGDEVVTVPFTWISSAEVILLVGSTPVFVDIRRDSYNIDEDKIERVITSRTKAILVVSLFGQTPEMERIVHIGERHGIPVIEDAAQSLGALRNGVRSGGLGTIGSTSFFPAKTLGCYGDGGAIFCDDDVLADRMRAIRTHGGIQRHHHPYVGMNGRFDTLQAAILLAKWDSFEGEILARGRIGARYSQLLSDICEIPRVLAGNTHVFSQYTIRIRNRDAVAAILKSRGIPTGIYYPKCLHQQPVFKGSGIQIVDMPEAELAASCVLSLPMHPFLTETDQDLVVNALHDAIRATS